MKVQELIDQLAVLPRDAEVYLQLVHDEATPVVAVAWLGRITNPSDQPPSRFPVVLHHGLDAAPAPMPPTHA